MSLIFSDTTSEYLSNLPLEDGRLTFVKDKKCLYRDTKDERVQLTGNPISIIVSENCISISCTNKYINITVEDDDTSLNFTTS